MSHDVPDGRPAAGVVRLPLAAIYDELIGFVPPRIQHRIRLGLEVDPALLDQVETLRKTAMIFDEQAA